MKKKSIVEIRKEMKNVSENFKLNKSVKNKWLKALRSGKYAQTTGKLFRGKNSEGQYTMCCLGVLEHILSKDKTSLLDEMQDNDLCFPRDLENPQCPEILQGNHDIGEILAFLNDGDNNYRKYSFKQIANFIEKEL